MTLAEKILLHILLKTILFPFMLNWIISLLLTVFIYFILLYRFFGNLSRVFLFSIVVLAKVLGRSLILPKFHCYVGRPPTCYIFYMFTRIFPFFLIYCNIAMCYLTLLSQRLQTFLKILYWQIQRYHMKTYEGENWLFVNFRL